LQKLERFSDMNASQLLEVATKVFVNQDQEADRKMKRKVDLLAVVLAGQSAGPGVQAMAEEEDGGQCLKNGLTLERN
jgi:hypothetical protein